MTQKRSRRSPDRAQRLQQTRSRNRWTQKGPDQAETPIPILGPDVIDPRRIPDIKTALAELSRPAAVETQPGSEAPAEEA